MQSPSFTPQPGSYRERIYAAYAVNIQDADECFDAESAAKAARAYAYHLRAWLPEGKDARILDLACGSGKALYFFREHGYRELYGVDIAPDQVALARQIVPGVEQADILEYLERAQPKFDLIIALDIVEHFRKAEVFPFLDRCFFALQPGGRLVLQSINCDSPWAMGVRYGDFTHEVCFGPNSLSRLLRICGYTQVVSREQGPIPRGYSFLSTLRAVLWRLYRFLIIMWNLTETGSSGSGIFTRSFVISAVKPTV